MKKWMACLMMVCAVGSAAAQSTNRGNSDDKSHPKCEGQHDCRTDQNGSGNGKDVKRAEGSKGTRSGSPANDVNGAKGVDATNTGNASKAGKTGKAAKAGKAAGAGHAAGSGMAAGIGIAAGVGAIAVGAAAGGDNGHHVERGSKPSSP